MADVDGAVGQGTGPGMADLSGANKLLQDVFKCTCLVRELILL